MSMSPLSCLRRVGLLAPLAFVGGTALFSAPDASPRAAAAIHLTNLEFQAAAMIYAELPPDSLTGNDRLAWAAALLNAQPRTEANVRSAAELLESVRSSETALRPLALFWLSRLWQDHAHPADPARARRSYEELANAFPDHPLAEIGLVRLTALDLLELPAPEEESRWAEIETRADRLSTPATRRDFHWLFAQAWLDAGGAPARALPHLEIAAELGFSNRHTRSNTLVQIAEIARASDDVTRARAAYRTFLAENPRDARRHLVTERLAALPSDENQQP